MAETVSSGDSLTEQHILDFIESADRPRKKMQLVAPNWEIAQLWSKQYPDCEILVSSNMLPPKERTE